MSKRNAKMGTGSVLIVVLLMFGAFTGAAALVTKGQFNLVSVSWAESGSSDDDNDEDEDRDEDEDEDEKKAQEEAEKKAERQREDAKKQLERNRELNKKQLGQSGRRAGLDDDISENEDGIAETDGDNNNGMFKDRAKTLMKLQEELAKAKEKILKQQAEGVDVTVALARLAVAEASITQVGASFDANDVVAAKVFAKQIKKDAHFAEKDAKNAEKVADALVKVEKRFGQVDTKMATLKTLGGDTTVFEKRLAALRAEFVTLKAEMAVNPEAVTRDRVRAFEKQVKRLKSLVESTIFALGGTDDDDLFEDHEDDADDLSEDLDDVAEIEDGDDNGVSGKVRRIAAEHKAASKAVEQSLGDIKNRGGLVKAFFGADFDALEKLNQEIAAQNKRVAELEQESEQVADPEIKQILDEQVSALKQEAAKLRSFIVSQSENRGIFGWFANFIPRF